MSSSSSAERAAGSAARRGVAVLGSTGSIGRQTLDVLAGLRNRFEVVALAAGRNGALLAEQAAAWQPRIVALVDGDGAALDLPGGTERLGGEEALVQLATRDDVDMVIVGTGGIVSLRPVLAALRAGKVVATANKETLVAGGHLVMPLARAAAERAVATAVAPTRDAPADVQATTPLAYLRPIDSEHSAIWQCLAGERTSEIDRLILTASGGPFLDLPADAFARITTEQALRHPRWTMGAKITIDSATLANKGLEVIEARWLYDVAYDAIDVVVHPQSVVHSAVLFRDGSVKAQLGTPDMRLPIQYALTYPRRLPSPAAAPDLLSAGRLEFRAPDEVRFPALRIARDAGRTGSRASAALIAADEVAVQRFLDGAIDFLGIPRLLSAAVERWGEGDQSPDVETLVALDAEVRAATARMAA